MKNDNELLISELEKVKKRDRKSIIITKALIVIGIVILVAGTLFGFQFVIERFNHRIEVFQSEVDKKTEEIHKVMLGYEESSSALSQQTLDLDEKTTSEINKLWISAYKGNQKKIDGLMLYTNTNIQNLTERFHKIIDSITTENNRIIENQNELNLTFMDSIKLLHNRLYSLSDSITSLNNELILNHKELTDSIAGIKLTVFETNNKLNAVKAELNIEYNTMNNALYDSISHLNTRLLELKPKELDTE